MMRDISDALKGPVKFFPGCDPNSAVSDNLIDIINSNNCLEKYRMTIFYIKKDVMPDAVKMDEGEFHAEVPPNTLFAMMGVEDEKLMMTYFDEKREISKMKTYSVKDAKKVHGFLKIHFYVDEKEMIITEKSELRE